MRFCNLGSGSGGNASLVEASQGITHTQLLVDCGFSLRELTRRLQRAGSSPELLNGIFITHEHGDHIGCALKLSEKYKIPLWTSRGTWRSIAQPDFPKALLHFLSDGEEISLGDMSLQAFAVPHDAHEPLHLRCSDGARHLGLITDLGHASTRVIQALQACHALLLEFNHDEDLLRASNYPASLKRRILGSHGHLSNTAAGELLRQCLHPGLRHVVGAHLSERNNRPELAAQTLAKVLNIETHEALLCHQQSGHPWLSV